MENLLKTNLPLIKKDFVSWLESEKKDGKDTGKMLFTLHNKLCENLQNWEESIYDLDNAKEFGEYFITCGYKKYLLDNNQHYNGKRWGLYISYADSEENKYIIYDDNDLLQLVLDEFENLAQYVIAYPHEYPVALYELVSWRIINSLDIISLFELD